jgi:hypothetical protein
LTLGILACAQGVVASVHVDQVLSQQDTRAIARKWMTQNIPKGSKLVIEPGVVPEAWLRDLSRGTEGKLRKRRWVVWSPKMWDAKGLRVDEYPGVLNPGLIKRYQVNGYCWLVTSSTQRGRVERQPERSPQGMAFYHSLVTHSKLAFRVSPWQQGASPVPFSFDNSFDYLPSAYQRPGPVISVYKLKGNGCGS